VRAALEAPALRAPAHLAQAKAGAIGLAAEQLLLIHRQRKAWEQRLGELLGERHPDGEIYLALPGLDIRLSARVLGEVGDGALDFAVANELQCYAGSTPGDDALRQARDDRLSARLQPPPPPGDHAVGLLQPHPQRLGTRFLR
jgi:transposase